MIHCPYCGTINKDDARVCVECGQPLPVLTADGMLCPQCGARNELGAVFCDECGTRLMPASPAATEQEPAPYASVRGISLPKKQTGDLESPLAEEPADIAEEVPSWLQKLLVAHDLVQPAQEEEEPVTLKDREIELPAVKEAGELPIPVELPEEGAALVTDWLETLRSRSEDWEQEAAEAQEVPLPSDDELTDWLHDLQESEAEVEPAPPVEEVSPSVEAYPIEDIEFPAWLSDLEAEEEPAAALVPPADESPAALTAKEEELPDWLLELRTEEPQEAVPSAIEAVPSPEEPALGESEDQEIPEWLREMRELGRDEGEEVPPVGPAGLDIEGEEEVEPSQPPAFVMSEVPTEEEGKEFEVPQWLQELQEMGPITPAEELSAEVPSPPDWLAQPAVPGVGAEEDETLAPEWLQGLESLAGEVPDEEVTPPDWLSELAPPVSAAVEMEAIVEAPDWLEELRPAAEEEEPGEVSRPHVPELPEMETVESPEESVAGAEEEPEGLARADIPDWLLALRPREPGEEPAEVQEIMELGGPLAGIRGVLPVEPIIGLPHLTRPKAATVEPPPISGDLFAEIVAQPPVPAAVVPERARARLLEGVQRVLIYLLLLAAVVVPILVGPIYGPLDAADLWAGAESFYAVLDGRGGVTLPESAAVIVAFDYNPATAAELSLQARAVIDHLMRRGVRIMGISLYPEGAALAWDVLDELATEQSYVYGENYIHLGYLPNQPASVRHFLNSGPTGEGQSDYQSGLPVSQYAVAQGMTGLSSVDLVVELAGDASTLRTWVEQITAQADIPVVAGVSAATAPYARPYLDSGQLRALLVGVPGAAEYEAQLGRSGRAIDSLGSQVAAQAVVILLILLGNLVHLVTRGGKR